MSQSSVACRAWPRAARSAVLLSLAYLFASPTRVVAQQDAGAAVRPASADSAAARSEAPFATGDRVRLRVPAAPGLGNHIVGSVVLLAPDSIMLQRWGHDPEGAVVARQEWVPLDCVIGAQVSAGRMPLAPSIVLGAVEGGAIGAAVGLLAGLASPGWIYNKKRAPGEFAWLAARPGIVIGAFVGAKYRRERWRAMPLPARPALDEAQRRMRCARY